jgi:hypothetical protein
MSKGVEIRDKLNAMIDELLVEPDMDSQVISCCLAVAVEELEKWIYDNQFTPSVIPADVDTSGWFKQPEDKSGDDWVGPPWDRRRKTMNERFPTLAKVKKAKKVKKPFPRRDMADYDIQEWSDWERAAFRDGNRSAFIRAVAMYAGVSMKEAKAYADIAIKEYSNQWGKS